jgi:hypothetical protein
MLMPWGDGSFQILWRINSNAYKADLPCEYDVNTLFNISDLSLFDISDNLKLNHFEKRGDNAIQIIPKDPLEVSYGLIVRSIVKKLKDTFNELIYSIWVNMNFKKAIFSTNDDQILINLIYV